MLQYRPFNLAHPRLRSLGVRDGGGWRKCATPVVNRSQDQVIEANGLNFHYREWGDVRTKHALVLLHDYAQTASAWDEVAADLSREYRVIALDQRGYGKTDRVPDHDYSRASQVADLEAIVELLGLRTVTLIGHGMGGANAICFAAEHPDMVTALIAIEVAPEVLRSGVETMRRVVATGDEFAAMSDLVEVFHRYYPYATTEQLERRARASLAPTDDGGFAWAFDAIFRDATARPPEADPGQRRLQNLWDSVEHVQCPVMIVTGSETDMITPEAVQRLHRRILGSRRSLIEEAGHSVPTDQPSALSQHIREFLQSLSISPL
ncbi:MAG: alpha/beta hydrolase [Chloroflexi bacterium]|nr:MAG: alpha/beta hydrolase [Chloroflexota bacterium]